MTQPEPRHRWSGWPGAWCLDCGSADPMELCVAEHWVEDQPCPEHPPTPCPEPNSRRHDPYARPLS